MKALLENGNRQRLQLEATLEQFRCDVEGEATARKDLEKKLERASARTGSSTLPLLNFALS